MMKGGARERGDGDVRHTRADREAAAKCIVGRESKQA